jgi:hypothetical protein
METVTTIDAYRGADSRFTFFTLDEVRRACAPYFKEVRRHVATYEAGERFQTMLFEAA